MEDWYEEFYPTAVKAAKEGLDYKCCEYNEEQVKKIASVALKNVLKADYMFTDDDIRALVFGWVCEHNMMDYGVDYTFLF